MKIVLRPIPISTQKDNRYAGPYKNARWMATGWLSFKRYKIANSTH